MYSGVYDLNISDSALLEQFQQGTDYVNVEAIAKAYKIELEFADIEHDGELCCVGTGKYLMRVNKNHPSTRQRFTIAHELGHFILHRDGLTVGQCIDRSSSEGLQDYKEIEANRLAADILMPTDLIDRLLDLEEINSVQQLARRLQVSEQSLRIRLDL